MAFKKASIRTKDGRVEIQYDPKLGFSFSKEGNIDYYKENDRVDIIVEGKKETFEKITPFEAIKIAKSVLKSPATLISPVGISIKRNAKEVFEFVENNLKDFFDLQCPLKIIKKAREINTNNNVKLPVEFSLFLGVVANGFLIDKIVLIAFPHEEKYEHLEALSAIFRKLGLEVVEEKLNFSPSNKETYPNLFRDLWNLLDEKIKEEKGKTVLFNSTSSYKIVTLITTLMTFHSRKSAFYSFENSPNFLEIPPFGMDWDYAYLDEIFPFIQMNSEDILDIPPEIQDIYLDGRTPYYPIEKIKELYREKRDVPFDYGERFINLIDSSDLKEYLREGIKRRWSYMWIGDQIPETVEHSQRHSRRLMNLAHQILRVMGYDRFINSENLDENYVEGISYQDLFLFLLGASIYIHDLGHVYPILRTKKGEFVLDGFPSLIRDLHSELTVSLIESGEYNVIAKEKPFRKGSKSLKDIFDGKTDEVAEAIKLICRYHRKYLPIEEENSGTKPFVKIFDLETHPLVEVVKEKINDEALQKLVVRAAKWLQFIDGLDVQADRTVTESYQNMRVERTANEISYLLKKLERRSLNIPHVDIEKVREILEEISNLNKENRENQNRASELNEKASELEKELYAAMEKGLEDILRSPDAELVFKIAFKARQFVHFNKHKSVNTIMPLRFQDSTLYIKIFPNPDFSVEEIKDELEEIKNEIYEEHQKAYLKDFNIEVIVDDGN